MRIGNARRRPKRRAPDGRQPGGLRDLARRLGTAVLSTIVVTYVRRLIDR